MEAGKSHRGPAVFFLNLTSITTPPTHNWEEAAQCANSYETASQCRDRDSAWTGTAHLRPDKLHIKGYWLYSAFLSHLKMVELFQGFVVSIWFT